MSISLINLHELLFIDHECDAVTCVHLIVTLIHVVRMQPHLSPRFTYLLTYLHSQTV